MTRCPHGLELSQSGVIGGAPPTAGAYWFTAQAWVANGIAATEILSRGTEPRENQTDHAEAGHHEGELSREELVGPMDTEPEGSELTAAEPVRRWRSTLLSQWCRRGRWWWVGKRPDAGP